MGVPAALAAALYPALLPGPARRIVVLLVVIGAAGLGMALVSRWPRAIGWSIAILVIAYGVALADRDRLDPAAPLYGTALLLVAEVEFTILERLPGRDRRLGSDWAARAATLVVVSVVSGGLVLALAAVPVPHGAIVQVAGVGVAAALAAGASVLMNRRS